MIHFPAGVPQMKSKSRSRAAVLSAAVETLEPRRLLAAGVLDTTFGNGGVAIRDILADNVPDRALQVLPMADGRVVSVGQTTLPDTTFSALSALNRVIITRYNTNGSLDTTFDGDGIAVYDQADQEGFSPNAAVLN